MASVNKVILVGGLTAAPELKYTQNQTAVCNFSVATSEKYNDKEQVEYHRVVCWNKTAENCSKYLDKGRQVYIEGRLQTRSWEDKEGQKRYTTEVVAQTVQFLGGSKGDVRGVANEQKGAGVSAPVEAAPSEPSIPF